MKVPRSWLDEFLPVDAAGISDDAIVAALDGLGLVVDGIERLGVDPVQLDGVVVGEVVTIRPHPNADKLRVVDVRIADGAPPIDQIVCGAWNFAEGDRVPVAMLGTTMRDGTVIKAAKLRGQASHGMLCSARELGLSDDHGGILVLAADAPLGAPVAAAVDTDRDTVFDLAIEANRPDAMSVLGVARDLAPVLGLGLDATRRNLAAPGAPPASTARGTVTAADLCDRLTVTVIRGVRVVPSPDAVALRLTRAGMRPINNLVDASNIVMLELGIPSHAFDLDKLAGGRIGVRWASPGERLVTLDGVERTLSHDGVVDGVIVDGDDRAVAVAGIMGGASTEIGDTTTSVLLEIAHWHPMSIARSAKKLGLRSEASARYERNADRDAVPAAASRVIELMRLTCPDLVVESFDDLGSAPDGERVVRLRTDRVNLILGTSIDDAEIARLLAGIGFEVRPVGPGIADVVVPSWRPDCEAEINVIEEVGRHHGYGNIARVVPTSPNVGTLTPMHRNRRRVRQTLTALGVHEAWTGNLIGDDDLTRTGLPSSEAVSLANPMAAEESLLRTSLVPGLLRALRYNTNHRSPGVRLFETGHVFTRPRPRQVTPYEREHLGIVLAADGDDAMAAVGVLDAIVAALGTEPAALALEAASDIAGMHPTRSARIIATGTRVPIGAVGEIDPGVLDAWGIDRRVGAVRVDLENLSHLPRRSDTLRAVSTFPSSDIDLAFVVADEVPAATIGAALRRATGPLGESVTLFDVYRGSGVAAGHRSLAFRVRVASADRTLTDADLTAVRQASVDAAATLGAALRT